jgi:hypothetical protein
MSNGVTQVAGHVVEGLKSQPALLVVVVLNVLLLGGGIYVLMRIAENSAKDRQWTHELIDRCLPGREKT